MKHKHYDMIVAWAEGKQIQVKACNLIWEDREKPLWAADREYRIKPMRNPDMYKYVEVKAVRDGICKWNTCLSDEANLGLIFDSETGKLKSAEVL